VEGSGVVVMNQRAIVKA